MGDHTPVALKGRVQLRPDEGQAIARVVTVCIASAGERPAGRDGLTGVSLWLRHLPLPLGFGAALRCWELTRCDLWGEGEGLGLLGGLLPEWGGAGVPTHFPQHVTLNTSHLHNYGLSVI